MPGEIGERPAAARRLDPILRGTERARSKYEQAPAPRFGEGLDRRQVERIGKRERFPCLGERGELVATHAVRQHLGAERLQHRLGRGFSRVERYQPIAPPNQPHLTDRRLAHRAEHLRERFVEREQRRQSGSRLDRSVAQRQRNFGIFYVHFLGFADHHPLARVNQGALIAAPDSGGTMFVEVYYEYTPLIQSGLTPSTTLTEVASMVVRDNRDLTQIYNTPTATISTC